MTSSEVEASVKSCILSRKGGVPLNEIDDDYKELIGGGIPFSKFGYRSLEKYLSSMSGILLTKGTDGSTVLKVQDDKTAHLAALVNKQKTCSRTKKKSSFVATGKMRKHKERMLNHDKFTSPNNNYKANFSKQRQHKERILNHDKLNSPNNNYKANFTNQRQPWMEGPHFHGKQSSSLITPRHSLLPFNHGILGSAIAVQNQQIPFPYSSRFSQLCSNVNSMPLRYPLALPPNLSGGVPPMVPPFPWSSGHDFLTPIVYGPQYTTRRHFNPPFSSQQTNLRNEGVKFNSSVSSKSIKQISRAALNEKQRNKRCSQIIEEKESSRHSEDTKLNLFVNLNCVKDSEEPSSQPSEPNPVKYENTQNYECEKKHEHLFSGTSDKKNLEVTGGNFSFDSNVKEPILSSKEKLEKVSPNSNTALNSQETTCSAQLSEALNSMTIQADLPNSSEMNDPVFEVAKSKQISYLNLYEKLRQLVFPKSCLSEKVLCEDNSGAHLHSAEVDDFDHHSSSDKLLVLQNGRKSPEGAENEDKYHNKQLQTSCDKRLSVSHCSRDKTNNGKIPSSADFDDTTRCIPDHANLCDKRKVKLEKGLLTITLNQEKESGTPVLFDCQLVGDDFFLHLAHDTHPQLSYKWKGELHKCGLCISGQTIQDCNLQVIKENVLHDNVLLLLGVMNIAKGTKLSKMKSDLVELLTNALCQARNIVVLTLPPLIEWWHVPTVRKMVMKFNQWLKTLHTGVEIHIIDIWPIFVDKRGYINDHLFERFPTKIHDFDSSVVLWNLQGKKTLLAYLQRNIPPFT